MAAITADDLIAYSAAMAAMDPVVMADILNLVNLGFPALPEIFDGEDGYKTRIARIYIALHFASLPGAGEQRAGGAVTSESRGGLSRSYAAPPTSSGDSEFNDTQWGRRYLLLLRGSKAGWLRVPGARFGRFC